MKVSARGVRAAGAAMLLASALTMSTGSLPAVAAAAPQPQPVQTGRILGAEASSAISGQYNVELKDDAAVHTNGIEASARALVGKYGGTLGQVWRNALHGFAVSMSAQQAAALAADPDVAWVQQAQRMTIADTQAKPTLGNAAANWAIDRDDQRRLPLDNRFDSLPSAGAGVHVYVIDTGVHATNTDFGARVTLAPNQVTLPEPPHPTSDDCFGHGTMVAGLIGGAKYGVAKNVWITAVRALDCSGNAKDTDVASAINWVMGDVAANKWPAVINLSLGPSCVVPGTHTPAACPPGTWPTVTTAEASATAAGITVVAAAGEDQSGSNSPIDNCGDPVSTVPNVIAVGALNPDDSYASFSYFGHCISLWAPGVNVESDYFNPMTSTSNTATAMGSGTSFAAPQVAGAAAVLLSIRQFAVSTPAQVKSLLDAETTLGQITGLPDGAAPPGTGSPNKILYVPPMLEGSSLALAKTPSGTLQVFGANAAGTAFMGTQTAVNTNSWNALEQSVFPGWYSFGADANLDKRVELIGLTPAGQIYQRQQLIAANPTYSLPTTLNGSLQSVAAARNQLGALDLFGVNRDGTGYFSAQTTANGFNFSTWQPFTGALPRFTSVAAETDGIGLIEVFLVDTSGNIWRTAQTVPDHNTWSAPAILTAPNNRLVSEVAVAKDGNNNLELVGIDAQGIWLRVMCPVIRGVGMLGFRLRR